MKTPWMIVVFLMVSMTGGLTAQTLRADYLDGTVEVQLPSGKWKLLDEGAKVTSADVLRLSKNGIAELSDGPLKVHLGRDGVYSLGPLMAEAKKRPAQNLQTIVGDKLSKLVGAPTTSRVEVAQGGARGDAQGDVDLQWATEDETPAAGDGLASGKEDRLSLLLVKARALADQGRASAALKALADPGFKRGQPGYLEYALLVGSQGVEAGEYDLVLAKTAEALEILPEPEIVQNLLLAQALAYQGKGDLTSAKAVFRKAAALDVTSPAGKEAQRILATL